MAEMVEMAVEGVGQIAGGGHVALLRERQGERTVGIGVGAYPATWLSAHLAQVRIPRPNTYVLSLRVIEQLGGRIVRATIDDNGQSEPSAYLEVEGPAGVLELGCAAEDAIALASYGGVPILVHAGFFASGRRTAAERPPRRRQPPAAPEGAPPAEGGTPEAPSENTDDK
jgi:bifunctional DNase/RNase